jgi:hypothetical protein
MKIYFDNSYDYWYYSVLPKNEELQPCISGIRKILKIEPARISINVSKKPHKQKGEFKMTFYKGTSLWYYALGHLDTENKISHSNDFSFNMNSFLDTHLDKFNLNHCYVTIKALP